MALSTAMPAQRAANQLSTPIGAGIVRQRSPHTSARWLDELRDTACVVGQLVVIMYHLHTPIEVLGAAKL